MHVQNSTATKDLTFLRRNLQGKSRDSSTHQYYWCYKLLFKLNDYFFFFKRPPKTFAESPDTSEDIALYVANIPIQMTQVREAMRRIFNKCRNFAKTQWENWTVINYFCFRKDWRIFFKVPERFIHAAFCLPMILVMKLKLGMFAINKMYCIANQFIFIFGISSSFAILFLSFTLSLPPILKICNFSFVEGSFKGHRVLRWLLPWEECEAASESCK